MAKYEPKTPYYEIQKIALRQGWDKEAFGYLLDMGLGKSKVLIDNIASLRENRGLRRALIVGPKSICRNWRMKEIPEHLPDRHFSSARVVLWRGGHGAREREEIESALDPDYPGLTVLIVNIESISMIKRSYELCMKFVSLGKCLVGVDESSRIKNPDAACTVRLTAIGEKAEWRRILTGTPVEKNPLDLFSQFEFLKKSCLGFSSIYGFRSRFAVTRDIFIPMPGTEDPRTGESRRRKITVVESFRDLDELSRRMATHCIIAKKEDCLDLPPKMYSVRNVEMTEEQRRIYDSIKKYASAELASGDHVSYQQIVVRIVRLRQILCGYAVDEHGCKHDVPTKKLDELQSLIEESSGRFIIWCAFREDVERVCQRLSDMGRRYVQFHGGVSEADRSEAILRFQGVYGDRVCSESDRADDFVGTPDAGGAGITLTAANNVVYYSNSDNYGKRAQSEDRAHRIGQTGTVTVTDLICPDTVEEGILENLREKKNLADLMSEGPARFRERMRL